MKTEFYLICEESETNIWRNNKPCKLWFVMENHLYDPSGSTRKICLKEGNIIGKVLIDSVTDMFSDSGILRTVVLFIL